MLGDVSLQFLELRVLVVLEVVHVLLEFLALVFGLLLLLLGTFDSVLQLGECLLEGLDLGADLRRQ